MNNIHSTDFIIAGRPLRAFFDDNKLIFVLDLSVSDIKPNVLLVINPDGDRKWDDILSNDYGIVLENVRPKKDNKYQKLDIEYDGLAFYDKLIKAYENQEDLSDLLVQMDAFYKKSAKRIALERLDAAEEVVAHANETMAKTMGAIDSAKDKLKKLRADMVEAKRAIGTEPTKRSASRVLRIDALIDAMTEKIARAQKRLQNARKRLESAGEDAAVAQGILDILNSEQTKQQHKVENMADDEIKPLFDTNPNILDDNIAFKPISFDTEDAEKKTQQNTDVVDMGIKFTPVFDDDKPVVKPVTEPVETEETLPEVVFDKLPDVVVEKLPEVVHAEENLPEVVVDKLPEVVAEKLPEVTEKTVPEHQPVIETLSFVPPVNFEEMSKNTEETTAPVAEVPVLDTFKPIVSEQNHMVTDVVTEPEVLEEVLPVTEEIKKDASVVANIDNNAVRPASPIAEQVVNTGVVSNKPTKIYYIMLIVLIVLSVFTLWLYQKSSNDNMPELGANTNSVQVVEEEPVQEVLADKEEVVTDTESPFIDVVSVADKIETKEPVPVETVTDDDTEEVVAQDVAVADTTETVSEEVVEVSGSALEQALDAAIQSVETVEETTEESAVPVVESVPVIDKPVYNVSQQEKMFVAAPDYETDDKVCADGNMPDADGCCSGESLTEVNGEFVCCADGTDQCFPPII